MFKLVSLVDKNNNDEKMLFMIEYVLLDTFKLLQ